MSAADVGQGSLDRRAFLAHAALAAAGIALCACTPSTPTAPASVSFTMKVGDYPALATVGGVALVSAHGSPLAVVRTGTATFLALSRICPHRGTVVSPVSTGFYCSGHGAQFDATGAWTGGQPTSSMTSYDASYDSSTDVLTIG